MTTSGEAVVRACTARVTSSDATFGPDRITGAIDGDGMVEAIVGITRVARAVDGASANEWRLTELEQRGL